MLRPPRPASLLASLRRAWRRSLQLRVVTITVATTGVLALIFGLVVGSLITNGLIDARHAGAKSTVDKGSVDALNLLNSQISGLRDPLATSKLNNVVKILQRPVADVAVVAILPEPVPDSTGSQITGTSPPIPQEFRAAVRRDGYSSQRLNLDLGQGQRLYLVFGRQVTPAWGEVQIFYLFPLDEVVEQSSLVTNTIAVTGIALVGMIAFVVFFVTRMVVSPVRVAARTAQRLSNGLLDQRMEVAGEDDLAALAASFNQMAETLQRHILRLEDMSRLQRRFTSDVSHELRTPLTTVRMAADLLFNSREDFDPAVARSAELLQTELDRFEALLGELLEISRFDAGFAALDAEATNLAPLVERVVERLASVAERAGVDLEMDVPIEPVVAEIDVRRVERILRNLIGNAIEHGEGLPVKVRLAAREGAVAITVRDYGVGLRPGEEKLVFNRFWRADPSRARHTGGTGLGLSISAEDARLHGGWLEAWGSPGQGAQFRLTVPARAGSRLVSSPLRLVPTDFRPPTEAGPEPRIVPRPVVAPIPPVVAGRSDAVAEGSRGRG